MGGGVATFLQCVHLQHFSLFLVTWQNISPQDDALFQGHCHGRRSKITCSHGDVGPTKIVHIWLISTMISHKHEAKVIKLTRYVKPNELITVEKK